MAQVVERLRSTGRGRVGRAMRGVGFTVLAAGGLALAACTAVPIDPPSTPPQSSATATGSGTDALYGKNAVFLSAFVAGHPAAADPLLLTGTFVLEKAAVGPSAFDLPVLNDGDDELTLAIFCDAGSPYELAVTRAGETVDRTWGEACGAGNLALYTTAPIHGGGSDLKLVTTVDPGTSYRVSVLESNPTG